ncbi:MAG: acyltransferase family protein [Gordonia sp. (in: high G+C Gram-positive bacteria)]
MSTGPQPAYRSDLDGLRGIAIALVACFHIWFGRVSGGVDVFLTLSGYFFIGSLLRHVIASQSAHITIVEALNPLPRLIRLLRRLLPALVTVLVVVAVLTVLVVPQTRWANIGREWRASALYYQNWHLALNSQDYLAASSANSPLQHMWSMSVQGQFFLGTLILALIAAAALKLLGTVIAPIARPRTITIIAGLALLLLAAVSFYWAYLRMGVNQQWNYFDTFARLWEPLAGGLLAIWLPTTRIPTWLRNAAGTGALALIVTSGWWIDGVNSYPGPLALVPVGSTLLIIISGATTPQHRLAGPPRRQPMVNRMLASRGPVWLGSISYSLYLWHWPLLIFYLSWRNKNQASILDGIALVAVSIGLAWLTKRYIEDPLRTGNHRRARTGKHRRTRAGQHGRVYASAVSAVLVACVLATAASIAMWDRHVANSVADTVSLDTRLYPGARALLDGWPVPALDPRPSPLGVLTDFPATSTGGFISSFDDPDIHVGVYGDPHATRTIALAGGSHAEFWITALDALGKRNHFKVKTYLKMGCPLSTDPVPMQRGVPYPQCHDWVVRVMRTIIADKPDAVFTNSTRPRDHEPGDWMPDDYKPIFTEFMGAGIPILGIRDTPWPRNSAGSIDTPTCLAKGGNADSCASPRALVLSPSDPARVFAHGKPLFHPLDLSDGICTPTLCQAIVGNIIVYKDWHHLSASYVRTLTDALGAQMTRALPWTGAADH